MAQACGIDIGGSGVKGAIIELDTGELVSERVLIPTPHPATPDAVAEAVAQVVAGLKWTGPVGVTLPSVVTKGVVRTAANIDKSWIGADARAVFEEALGGRVVTVLNDADAAGLAEDRYGAAAKFDGCVLLLTFGTGIGSALISDGTLVPNTELGHLVIDGTKAEHRAAASIKTKNGWDYERWTTEVDRVLAVYETLMWPDVIVAGGGISAESDQWIPLLNNRTQIVPAALGNNAGIVGGAMAIAAGLRP